MNGSTWIDEGARSSRGNKIIKPHTRCVKVSPATARSEHFIPAPKQQVICRVHLCSKARPTLALSFCLAHVQNLTSHLSVKNSTSNYIYIFPSALKTPPFSAPSTWKGGARFQKCQYFGNQKLTKNPLLRFWKSPNPSALASGQPLLL